MTKVQFSIFLFDSRIVDSSSTSSSSRTVLVATRLRAPPLLDFDSRPPPQAQLAVRRSGHICQDVFFVQVLVIALDHAVLPATGGTSVVVFVRHNKPVVMLELGVIGVADNGAVVVGVVVGVV